ncbi:sugar ABC transporter ATP-binding protein [Saxibacter everestensis]|uniref:Sugar ABC transporter ATP-binding protein n=1 Tax=Saxibacter everestensis TaxID=2909229 RepID=A0ABY8QT78_9MICO|nr:sugar ABC transporter ATP-binding protein [Brevibacteriaceae bacterium ZFBP1038]
MTPHPATSARTEAPVVSARGVVKRFPGVIALGGMDFELFAHEVHCLVGENGAGKSTLIKTLSGFYQPDEGGIQIDGAPLTATTSAARQSGIATIYQEHNLVPYLSVAENVMLGNLGGRRGFVSRRAMHQRATVALSRVAPGIDPRAEARSLTVVEGKLVEIARAVAQNARVMILDEPTTALADADVDVLYRLIGELKASGMAILYVSHRMEEVLSLADRITVIRDGKTVASSLPAGELDQDQIVRLMVGDEVKLFEHTDREAGAVVLEARALSREGAFYDINLGVRSGEIVGLAGLIGAGRTEIARCIYGADKSTAGQVFVDGKRLRPASVSEAVRNGIGLVPEERKLQSIIPMLTVEQNITLSVLRRIKKFGAIRKRAEADIASRYIADLRIKTPSARTQIRTLSGGNQQKAIIARCLVNRPKVLILDEPTKGIDIGAKAEIHRLIELLAADGVAILVISSELPELMALSDRIIVIRDGYQVAELSRSQATKDAIMRFAAA